MNSRCGSIFETKLLCNTFEVDVVLGVLDASVHDFDNLVIHQVGKWLSFRHDSEVLSS